MEIDGENWTQDIGYFLLFFLIFVSRLGFFWLKRKAATHSSVDHLIKVPGMIGWDMIIINM